MPPQRTRSHHNRPNPSQQPSDYESDLNVPSSTTLPPPPMRTNAELNLSVLRRHNSAVESILSIAPYAVVYLFSVTTQQWEKSGIEGTLFVCQISSQEAGVERYAVVVLNRRGLQNFTAELLDGGDVEVTEEYVILQVMRGKPGPFIYGIWIFCEPAPSSTANARAINAQIIQECAAQAETSRRLAVGKLRRQVEAQDHTRGESSEQQGTAEETTESIAMGRQVSLRELFGQQREDDSGWSVKLHPREPSRQFTPSADTEFFRSTVRPSRQTKHQGQKAQDRQSANGT